ncbi:protein FAR1-RELATED SEQUENCE 4-like [Salvia splendens]|nr:protein FAR1-RELATED SEQUENCE 4-like [Salvia splendens]
MDVDDEGRLRNVMWVHPRSIAAYEEFHDVVSFDTTYLVNKYKMPWATVVGVNQHNQSILLGCGLLSHEQSESFKWFFSNWLLAMKGVQPTAMLTDQCESIKIAVKAVFPMTIHRLCLWHIANKIPQKFKGMADFRSCSSDFYSTIYDSLSIAEFESRWTDFLSKHSLHNNRWLKNLFDEKKNWAPIYSNHIFWAGMVLTQRSESMHAFFDGFVNSKSMLKPFVEQYEIAIQNKIQKEMNADYQSKCVMLKPVSTFQWEKQLLGEYTHNIDLLLQVEVKKISSCNVEDVAIGEDGVNRCKIKEMRLVQNVFHKEYTYTVEYRPFGE